MNEGVFSKHQLVALAAEYLEFQAQYGPFRQISQEAAKASDSNYVWTALSSAGRFLQNGYFEGVSTFLYFLASRPCNGPQQSRSYTTVAWVECKDCDGTELRPEGCEKCEWSGGFVFDLDQIVNSSSIDLGSEEAIWSQRVPSGSFDS